MLAWIPAICLTQWLLYRVVVTYVTHIPFEMKGKLQCLLYHSLLNIMHEYALIVGAVEHNFW